MWKPTYTQPGHKNRISHWKMCQADYEKEEKEKKMEGIELPNQESIWTLRKKRKLQVPENTGSRHSQINRDERKSKKRIFQKNRKIS